MNKKYFGTDGIRGRVGEYPVCAEFFLKLGWATGKALANQQGAKVLIGKDTRISGYMFESALAAGLAAAGVDTHFTGPMPTPAIAYLTRTLRAQVGMVISASHNPYTDNGIKFFCAQGFKLPDAVELQIEQQLEHAMQLVDSKYLGKARRVKDAPGRYIEFCKSTVPHQTSLKGLKIVVDCANGATYEVAPSVLRELGADVIAIGVHPDGMNINAACGSTSPAQLQKKVLDCQADVGIALDGDGDRVIMVDHKGEIVDGDELLWIITQEKIAAKSFQGGVMGTLMTNLGLELALQDLSIPFMRSAVGDRYVMAALEEQQWCLGGEASGHIICLDVTTTGDGIISALQVLRAMVRSEKDLHTLKSGMTKFPQTMINVAVTPEKLTQGKEWLQNAKIQQAVQQADAKLAKKGRVLLRMSGTEPVVRVMVEGEDPEVVTEIAQEIANVVEGG